VERKRLLLQDPWKLELQMTKILMPFFPDRCTVHCELFSHGQAFSQKYW
jgi:hypothetical protein